MRPSPTLAVRSLILLAGLVTASCGTSVAEFERVDMGPGLPCELKTTCPSGESCMFSPGCPGKGTCWSGACTADYAEHCGCDGTRFFGSSTCVPMPHSGNNDCAR